MSGAVQWTLSFPNPSPASIQAVEGLAFDPIGPDIFVATRQGPPQSRGFVTLHHAFAEWTALGPIFASPAAGLLRVH